GPARIGGLGDHLRGGCFNRDGLPRRRRRREVGIYVEVGEFQSSAEIRTTLVRLQCEVAPPLDRIDSDARILKRDALACDRELAVHVEGAKRRLCAVGDGGAQPGQQAPHAWTDRSGVAYEIFTRTRNETVEARTERRAFQRGLEMDVLAAQG